MTDSWDPEPQPTPPELSDFDYWSGAQTWKGIPEPPEPSWRRRAGPLAVQEQRPVEVALCGPRGCGKTSWIAALGQAMSRPPTDPQALRIVPRQNSVQLEELALGIRGARVVEAPLQDPMIFEIGPIGSDHGLRRVTFHEVELDAERPDCAVEPLLAALSTSVNVERCLVLCTDSVSDHALTWQRFLIHFLDRFTQPTTTVTPAPFGVSGPRPFDRILLSLNRTDIVCSQLLALPKPLRHKLEAQGLVLRSIRDTANHLDVLERFRQQLGTAGLYRLSACVGTTDLALGPTSAHGLDGMPNGSAASSRSASFQAWRPYGLLESVRFLVFGKVTEPLEHFVSSQAGSVVPILSTSAPGTGTSAPRSTAPPTPNREHRHVA